nr:hypothetical protein [Hyphomonas sp. 34-62-18]
MTTLTVLIAGRTGQVARVPGASVPEGVSTACLSRLDCGALAGPMAEHCPVGGKAPAAW